MISRCTKLNEKDIFGLNIIMASSFKKTDFKKSIQKINNLISNREVHAFIFLGDPQIPELGSEVFNISNVTDVSKILRDHITTFKLTIEVYSTFSVPSKVMVDLVDQMEGTGVSWKVSPLYFFNNDLKDFILNISLCNKRHVLGEITCIIRDSHRKDDLNLFNVLKNIFRDSLLSTAPLRWEEDLFENVSNYVSHEIEFEDHTIKRLSFYELLGLQISYKGLHCDIRNHLEIDLLGNIFACSTGYENSDSLEITKCNSIVDICDSFKCPYNLCKHNDNMSLSSK